MSGAPDRIAVFRVGHLGDTLMALPAFWAIRRMYPDAHLTLISNINSTNAHYVSASNVLPAQGLFDSYIYYPNATNLVKTLAGFGRLAVAIRRGRYDTLIYLMPRGRVKAQIERDERFFRFAGIKELIGTKFAIAKELPEHPPVPSPCVQSEGEFLLDCLRDAKILGQDVNVEPDLKLTPEEIKKGSDFIEAACNENVARAPLIAVAPGTKWPSKTWGEGNFVDTVSRLIKDFNVFPVVFGGPEDSSQADRMLARWKRGVRAAGVLGVREAAAALRHCSLFLGNDTGTMHLAAAVGVPCVAIFAANNWAGQWYPYGNGHRVFRAQTYCEGCVNLAHAEHHTCLDLIDPEEVLEACRATIAATSPTFAGADQVRI